MLSFEQSLKFYFTNYLFYASSLFASFPAIFNLHTICCADNCQADEQQKQSESQIQSSSPAPGMSHTVMTTPNVQYASPPQYGAGHAVVLSRY